MTQLNAHLVGGPQSGDFVELSAAQLAAGVIYVQVGDWNGKYVRSALAPAQWEWEDA